MATATPKTIVTYNITGESVSHARTDVETRDVDMTIDEPVARGGTNMGLAPTEVLVAALIGCTNVIGQRVGESHGVHFEDLKIDAAADFDRRGVMMQEEVDVPFPKIVLTISGKSNADDAALEKVKTDLGRFCPIAKVIRQSGTEIEEIWNITRT
jgi:putative redox protein